MSRRKLFLMAVGDSWLALHIPVDGGGWKASDEVAIATSGKRDLNMVEVFVLAAVMVNHRFYCERAGVTFTSS